MMEHNLLIESSILAEAHLTAATCDIFYNSTDNDGLIMIMIVIITTIAVMANVHTAHSLNSFTTISFIIFYTDRARP